MRITVITSVFCSILFSQFDVFAQENKEYERIINEQVWKPFAEAMQNKDWKKYNGLHTENVLSISSWGIKQGSEFKDQIREWYSNKEDRSTKTIDFSFEYRVYSENMGSEVGFYRITKQSPDGSEKVDYGRFHVLLEKEKGTWKIAMDWDDSKIGGEVVTETDFNSGKFLSFRK